MGGVRTTRWLAALLGIAVAASLAGCAAQATDDPEDVSQAEELLVGQGSLGGDDGIDPDDEDPAEPAAPSDPPGTGTTTSNPLKILQDMGGADPEPVPWHEGGTKVTNSSSTSGKGN